MKQGRGLPDGAGAVSGSSSVRHGERVAEELHERRSRPAESRVLVDEAGGDDLMILTRAEAKKSFRLRSSAKGYLGSAQGGTRLSESPPSSSCFGWEPPTETRYRADPKIGGSCYGGPSRPKMLPYGSRSWQIDLRCSTSIGPRWGVAPRSSSCSRAEATLLTDQYTTGLPPSGFFFGSATWTPNSMSRILKNTKGPCACSSTCTCSAPNAAAHHAATARVSSAKTMTDVIREPASAVTARTSHAVALDANR
jgi:hypothetical protein